MQIYFLFSSQIVDFRVYLTSDSWNELTINWNNMPSIGALIITCSFSDDGENSISIFNEMQQNGVEGKLEVSFILICVENDYCTACSKENMFSSRHPYLVYTITIEGIPSYNIFILLAIVGLIFPLLIKKKLKNFF